MSEGGAGQKVVDDLERSREREEAAERDRGGPEVAAGEGEGEEEAEAGMEDGHKELARDMFEMITEYLNGELAGTYEYTHSKAVNT